MRYTFDGKTYVIEFKRVYREYPHTDVKTGLQLMRKSTNPYTTVTILETTPGQPVQKVFRTATVGCHHGDRFSLEKGRCRALRLATITLPLQMKPILWKAYHDRRNTDPKSQPTSTVGEGHDSPSASVGGSVEA